MMEVYNNEILEIDVKESFFILLHKLWLIGIIGILFAVCTGMVNLYLLTPVYSSTSRVYMINQQSDYSTALVDQGTGSQLTIKDIDLVKSREVMKQVIQQLKLDLSPEELAQRVTVGIAEDTWILEINVVYSNPAMTKLIADTIAKAYEEQLIHGLKAERITIIEEGNLPTIPFNPNLSKNVFLGAVCGILFSIAFLALGHLPKGSIHSIEYFEQYIGTTHSVVYSLRRRLTGGRKERSVR